MDICPERMKIQLVQDKEVGVNRTVFKIWALCAREFEYFCGTLKKWYLNFKNPHEGYLKFFYLGTIHRQFDSKGRYDSQELSFLEVPEMIAISMVDKLYSGKPVGRAVELLSYMKSKTLTNSVYVISHEKLN